MKKIAFTALLLSFFLTTVFYSQAQSWVGKMNNPNATFFDVQTDARNYYNSDTNLTKNNAYGYKTYLRWETFWQDRLSNTTQTIGDMNAWNNSISEFSVNRSTLCSNSGSVTLNDNWLSLGPDADLAVSEQQLGMIISIAVDPADANIIYAGSTMAGIFKSTDGGATFPSNITEALNIPGLGIRSIVIDPTSSTGNRTIYAGTGSYMGDRTYGAGLLKSVDNGGTWVIYPLVTTTTTQESIQKIILDPSNNQRLIVLGSKNVFVSLNGGTSFYSIAPVSQSGSKIFTDAEFLPGNSNVLFVSSGIPNGDDGGAELFRISGMFTQAETSENITATLLNQVLTEAIGIATTPADPSTLYIMSVGNTSGFKTQYFEKCGNPLSSSSLINFSSLGSAGWNGSEIVHFYKHSFEISDTDPSVIYVGGYKSIRGNIASGSVSFLPSLSVGHADVRCIVPVATSIGGTTDVVLFGHDGGISKTVNGGQTFTPFPADGMNNLLFYGVGVSNTTAPKIICGAQDHDYFQYDESVSSWSYLLSGVAGDATQMDFDKSDPAFAIGTTLYQDKGLKRIQNGIGLSQLNFPSFSYFPNFEIEIHSSNTYFFGFENVYKIKDPYGSPCFQVISDFPGQFGTDPNIPLREVAVAPSDIGVIYVAFDKIDYNHNPVNDKVLFKSTIVNGEYVWADISNEINSLDPGILEWHAITKIEINPNNPDEIWVAFNGIPEPGIRRVLHREVLNGVPVWSDYSQGLPQFPVNDIIFQNGSTDKTLYAATDVGVFYRNSSLAQWECYSTNLPTCIVSDLEINYPTGELYIATFGRGSFKSPVTGTYTVPSLSTPVEYGFQGGDVIITGNNEVWTSPRNISGTIEIMPGARLTVQTTVKFAPDSKVIVHRGDASNPGGRLFLDGGTFTSGATCGADQWGGIQVHGYPNESQDLLNTSKQGLLELSSGSLVENAKIGAVSGKANDIGTTDFQFAGGIIKGFSSTFKNNEIDVLFLSYQNFIPGNPSSLIANRSTFHNCLFTTTASTPFQNLAHVFAIGVTGIKISRSEFSNTASFNSTMPYQTAISKGIGIVALNSSIHLLGNCDDNSTTCFNNGTREGNIFKSLNYGIYAASSNLTQTIEIRKCLFASNYHGVFLNGLTAPSIYNNHFDILNYFPGTGNNDIPYAIHLNQCAGYELEANVIQGRPLDYLSAAPTAYPKVGVQVSLPDNQQEQVYNNTIRKMSNGFGVFVQGHPNDLISGYSGLQILCNDFSEAVIQDITGSNPIDYPSTYIYLTQNGKISASQGGITSSDPTIPAGNTFDNTFPHDNCAISGSGPDPEINLLDGNVLPITYYHHPEVSFATEPSCYTTTSISLTLDPVNYTSKQTACPQHHSASVHNGILLARRKQYTLQYNEELVKIDGGNTAALLQLVYNNVSPGQLRNAFIAKSPYLSDAVLLAAINDKPSPLPPGILKEIILANAPVSPAVWNAIVNRSPALPNGIMNQLTAAQNGISERKKLESVIEHYKNFEQEALYDLLRNYILADTVEGYLDSVKLLLSDPLFKFRECRMAQVLAAKKDYTGALAIIDQHLLVHPNDEICKMQKLMIELDLQLNKYFSMDTTQKQQLEEFAADYTKVHAAANALLKIVFNHEFPDERIIGNSTRSIRFVEEKEKENPVVTLYPNPSEDYAYLEYQSDDPEFVPVLMEIYSLDGRKVYARNITSEQKQLFISTTELSAGTYFVCLKSNERLLTATKLIVLK